MLNTYDVYYDTYVNDELVDSYHPFWSSIRILEEGKETHTITDTYTWDDIKGYKVIANNIYGYIRHNKKRMVVFGHKFKMEKTPNLTIKIITRYEKTECSIKEILSHKDSSKAIQYLVERGLNVFDVLTSNKE